VLVDHLNSWTMGLHEQVADGANDLMRLIHRVAQAAGDAVAYQDVARRMSKAQRQQNDSAAVATAMQALADLGVGEIQRGTRGATRYRSTAELP
jgi:type IV secretory pathway TrbL component